MYWENLNSLSHRRQAYSRLLLCCTELHWYWGSENWTRYLLVMSQLFYLMRPKGSYAYIWLKLCNYILDHDLTKKSKLELVYSLHSMSLSLIFRAGRNFLHYMSLSSKWCIWNLLSRGFDSVWTKLFPSLLDRIPKPKLKIWSKLQKCLRNLWLVWFLKVRIPPWAIFPENLQLGRSKVPEREKNPKMQLQEESGLRRFE